MTQAERIPLQLLKDKVDAACGASRKHILPYSQFSAGIPQGALVELTGAAKIEWLVQFLRENAALKVFWIEEKFTLLPTAIEQRGVSLERLVFVESREVFRPLRQALKSKVFSCAVTPRFTSDEKPLKALQLLAEESSACVFLLAQHTVRAWPLSIQLEISHIPAAQRKDAPNAKIFNTKILKHKSLGIL